MLTGLHRMTYFVCIFLVNISQIRLIKYKLENSLQILANCFRKALYFIRICLIEFTQSQFS